MDEEKVGKESQEEAPEEEMLVTDIEDIDAALDKKIAEDKGEEVEEERKEVNEEEDKDKGGESEEDKEKDKKGPDEEKGQEEETELEKLTKRVDELQDGLKKKDNQIRSQEDFIQRQKTEIGNLRKDRKEWREKLKEELAEKYPGENIDAMADVVEAHEQEAEKERETRGTLVRDNERFIRSEIKDFDDLLPDIADLCIEDGVAKEDVAVFKQNPFTATPDFLINMAKRVRAKRDAEKKVAELEAEIKGLKGETEEVVEKIDRAARQKPKVDRKSGQASKKEEIEESTELSEEEISNLSYEELEKRIKKSETKT